MQARSLPAERLYLRLRCSQDRPRCRSFSGPGQWMHYPQLSPTTSMSTNMSSGTGMASAKLFSREEQTQIAKPVTALTLHAAFVAMPHTDENDRETVLCYRSYFPARMASVY